jgi:hypothetical protein
MAVFFNDSDTRALYLKYGASASTSDYTVKLRPQGYFEMPVPVETGIITGIWDAGSGGAVLITEETGNAVGGGGGFLTTEQTIACPADATAPSGSSHNRLIVFTGAGVTVPAGKTRFRLVLKSIQGNGNSALLMWGAITPLDSASATPALGADGWYTANPVETYSANIVAANLFDTTNSVGFAIAAGDFKANIAYEWQ